MGIGAYAIYSLLMMLTSINIVSVIISILISVIFYFLLILKLNVLSKEEMEMLPMGDMLYSAAKKFKLIKE